MGLPCFHKRDPGSGTKSWMKALRPGATGENRTHDPFITSEALYP